ncbi:MAG: ATP-binding protein, partial [Desulfobacterales bacterium]|nr:ATP-binding protein [Desulfobacterales bacterium]
QILAHTFTTGFPKGFSPIPVEPGQEEAGFKAMSVGQRQVFHVSVPVKEGIYTIGSVQIGLDRAHIENLISRLRLVFLSFLSVVSFIFFFLSHRLALHITRPVTSLIRYTERLTRGDFKFLAQPDTETLSKEIGEREDEIAILSGSFVRMARELAASTDSLMESQKKYRSLFHSGPNPIFVVHKRKFEILDANPKATDLFGYSRDELSGMSLFSLGNLDHQDFERDYPEGESIVISSKVQLLTKGKQSIFANIHASPAEYRDKDVIIVATTDITELVEKDSQLIQASKMTNLEKMSVGIAHEINQPLNAIKMGSEYLTMMHERQKEVTAEDLAMVLREISSQVNRASQIVGRLKRFARKADFSREETNLNQCVNTVHKILGRQLALQNIEMVINTDRDLPPILAHTNRMEQVIFNLVTNARDAVIELMEIDDKTKIEQGKIVVTTFTDEDMVGLRVSDNGAGIEPDRMETIFDSFFTTKEMGEGLGLGLPIVQGIVRDYKGTISVESRPGQGASFQLLFPAHAH